MAGRGPAPKDPSRRARRNADVVPLRVVEIEPAPKPMLPPLIEEMKVDKAVVRVPGEWPEPTLLWWRMLDLHPLKGEFTELDWSYLLDTARIHAAFWNGDLKVASELRLREAKYGFTPEDRARLRIQFAQATEAEYDTARKVDLSLSRFDEYTVESMDPDVAS